MFGTGKLERRGYQTVKKFDDIFTWQTLRRTTDRPHDSTSRASLSIARQILFSS